MDFVITVENAPNYVKEKLLKLPNTPFEQRAQIFVYRTPTHGEIQIGMCNSKQVEFLLALTYTLFNLANI